MPETMLKPATAPAVTWVDTLRTAIFRRERGILIATVGFQVFVLLGMISSKAMVLWSGETVLIRVIPVDPRDFFRGEYVTLAYEFSRPGAVAGLPTSAVHDDSGLRIVYIPLTRDPGGKHWSPGTPSTAKPAEGPFLRGELQAGRIVCGIESYYVQEGQGRRYEQAIRNQRLYAEVAVNSEGNAALRGLKIE